MGSALVDEAHRTLLPPPGSPVTVDEPELSYLDREVEERSQRSAAAEHAGARELAGEFALSAVFAVSAIALLIVGPLEFEHPWLLLMLWITFGITSRIGFPIERNIAIPTQLILLPMLMLGPPAIVPLLEMVMPPPKLRIAFPCMAEIRPVLTTQAPVFSETASRSPNMSAAPLMLRDKSNCTITRVEPKLLEEVISVMPAIQPN